MKEARKEDEGRTMKEGNKGRKEDGGRRRKEDGTLGGRKENEGRKEGIWKDGSEGRK